MCPRGFLGAARGLPEAFLRLPGAFLGPSESLPEASRGFSDRYVGEHGAQEASRRLSGGLKEAQDSPTEAFQRPRSPHKGFKEAPRCGSSAVWGESKAMLSMFCRKCRILVEVAQK